MESAFNTSLLDGKVAFVTGGGSGICKGIVDAFMAHGARAAIVSRKLERLEATAKELSDKHGRECIALAADVRDAAAVGTAFDAALAKLGRVDIVVNGAAGNFLAPAAQLSPNGFKTVMDIDANGTFNVCRVAFDKWLRDHGGHVLNISATLHYGATPFQIHAASAKAAVDTITRTLAVEWGSLGIRVNGIAPGPIDGTEGLMRLMPPDLRKELEAQIPIGRFGRIDEIASIALFLVSPMASLITGTTIVADGGAWMTLKRPV